MINIVDLKKYKFYDNDILDFKEYPTNEHNEFDNRKNTIIDMSDMKSVKFKDIIKGYIENEMMRDSICYLTRVKSYLIPINYLLDFLRNSNYLDIENISSYNIEEMKQLYNDWLDKNNIHSTKKNKNGVWHHDNFRVLENLYKYELKSIKSNAEIWDNDIWKINELHLDPNRLNATDKIDTISFVIIKNESNKRLIKEYTKHMIAITNHSIKTISQRINRVKQFALLFEDKDISELTDDDIKRFYNNLDGKNLTNVVYNTTINTCASFLAYLLNNKIIKSNLLSIKNIKKSPRSYKLISVSEPIILQIFNVLDKIDEKLRLMFLINYCTGYRVSDICRLKIDCLYYSDLIDSNKKEKRRYFIQGKSQKMRKYIETPIPFVLYELILDRIRYIKDFNYDGQYLFPSFRNSNTPYVADTYRSQVQRAFIELGIRNQDGTDYIYKPHSYRHTLATDMVDLSIPFDVIRRILHHESPEMTLYYAEMRERKAIDKQKEYINSLGKRVKFEDDEELRDMADMEIMRKNINAQVLPNGFCGIPVKLGSCDAGNECLNCTKFRTDESFLEVHKTQLKKTEEFLLYARKNGWEIQIKTNERVRDSLIRIIKAIEDKEEEI